MEHQKPRNYQPRRISLIILIWKREFSPSAFAGTLKAAGHQAYFVGGCVRDILLGREPADYDVATDAPPDRVRELFSPLSAVLEVGAKFGVMLVVDPEGSE